MFTRHVSGWLAAYVDGALTPPLAGQVERHLGRCARCRTECDQVRRAMASLEDLPRVEAPGAIWSSIEAALGTGGAATPDSAPTMPTPGWWRPAVAGGGGLLAVALVALLAGVLAGTATWRLARRSEAAWAVTSLAGSPEVGATRIRGTGRVRSGEWVETDSASRAIISVGEIGSVEVTPNSRIRVVTARPDEHRLALERGEIRAAVTAPPRLFFVDTASGTAVDLGCEYTLDADEDGAGLIRVTKGWVSFEWNGLESLVPAGASCRTRPHVGPGIPYFDDAPRSLIDALEVFGFEKTGNESLGVILDQSRVRDTLTLWHLLSRVRADDRPRVYDRIATLTPVPAGVSREQALKLDPETLKRWLDELAWTW